MTVGPIDCYVGIRGTALGGEGVVQAAALLSAGISELRYTYERRFGCAQARVAVTRAKATAEYASLETLRQLGEFAIFARSPTGQSQGAHPWAPAPALDTTIYQRIWSGRVAHVRYDPWAGRVEVEAEGLATTMEEAQAVPSAQNQVFTAKRVHEIAASVMGAAAGIETTGRMAVLLDEFDVSGLSRRQAIDRLADIGGPSIDWGFDRAGAFYMFSRATPFHAAGGFLDSIGGEADLAEAEIERDLRGLRTEITVVGGKASNGTARVSGTFLSTLGAARFGTRHEDVLREEVRTFPALTAVGLGLLREKMQVSTRVKAEVRNDYRYALDQKGLRPVVLRTGHRTPSSYMSAQTTAPGAATSGFALRVAAAGAVLAVHPANIPATIPYYADVVRRQKSNPAVSGRFTVMSAALGATPTQPAHRLFVLNDAGTIRVRLEAYNGTSVVTVCTYTPPSTLIDVIASWGVQMRSGSGAIYRDGVSVATGSAAGVGGTTTVNSVLGAREDLAADVDDAEYQDYGVWTGAEADRAAAPTHPIFTELGAHTRAIQRYMTHLGRMANIVWIPFWEGVAGIGLETIGNFSGNPQARSTSIIVGATVWAPGLIRDAGGGQLGSPEIFDRRWGNGDLYGGSPIVIPDSLDREWRGEGGWRSVIEGGIGVTSLARPIAEIEHRLASLEAARRTETGVVLGGTPT